MTAPFGPFETEGQARRAAHAIVQPDDGWSILGAAQNRRLLLWACTPGGVRLELGAFDRRIIDWLAGWEDATCAVVAGLVIRAYAAGLREGEPADG